MVRVKPIWAADNRANITTCFADGPVDEFETLDLVGDLETDFPQNMPEVRLGWYWLQ